MNAKLINKTCKMLPFCSKNSGLILITSCSCEKRYQALPVFTYSRSGRGGGEPGNEARILAPASFLQY